MPNFRSVSVFVWPEGMTHINKQIHTHTYIQVKLGISSTGCSPHVDFDTYINTYTHILVKLRISSTGCSPHKDFDYSLLFTNPGEHTIFIKKLGDQE